MGRARRGGRAATSGRLRLDDGPGLSDRAHAVIPVVEHVLVRQHTERRQAKGGQRRCLAR